MESSLVGTPKELVAIKHRCIQLITRWWNLLCFIVLKNNRASTFSCRSSESEQRVALDLNSALPRDSKSVLCLFAAPATHLRNTRTNNLNSWVQVEPGYDFKELAFHPTNDSIVYTYNTAGSSTSNFLLISHDFGNTFTLSNNILGNNGNETVELVTSPQCEDCIWFGSNNGIWVSYDKGLNFKFLSNPDEACHGFAVSDIDTSFMVYGYVSTLVSGRGDSGGYSPRPYILYTYYIYFI